MPGRSHTAGTGYRYGFNGQEKVDEINGAGNHNTALFWEYDTRLIRRWNLDPKPNPSMSIYAAFANNSIQFSDPLGDTLRGHTENDAQQMLAQMKNLFGTSNEIFNKYFKLGVDGKTFEKIESRLDFNKWLNGKGEYSGAGSGFSKEQIALANGFMKTINSKFDIEVNFSGARSMFTPIDKVRGSVFIGSDSNMDNFVDNSGNLRQYSTTQTFVHEVLGEAYTSLTFNDLRTFDNLNTLFITHQLKGTQLKLFQAKELQVIQIENIYNRMNGYLRAAIPGSPGEHHLNPSDLSKVGLIPANFGSSFYY